MAIVFDAASAINQGMGVSTLTQGHVIGATTTYRIVLAGIERSGSSITSCKYGGVDMTLIDSISGLSLYYLVAPPVGAANLVVLTLANTNYSIGCVSYSGVDQAGPIGVSQKTGPGASPQTVIVTSEANQLVVDIVGGANSGGNIITAMTVGAGQTERAKKVSVEDTQARSDEPGAAAVTMNWTWVPAGSWQNEIAVPLRPFIPPRTRSVKYYFNVWDPRHEIRNEQGAVVKPEEILADQFIECDGFTLGESRYYDNFVADPTKSRIVSVGMNQGNVNIKTSKAQFADVIVRRAAAGRL